MERFEKIHELLQGAKEMQILGISRDLISCRLYISGQWEPVEIPRGWFGILMAYHFPQHYRYFREYCAEVDAGFVYDEFTDAADYFKSYRGEPGDFAPSGGAYTFRKPNRDGLTLEDINEIRFYGKREILGVIYTYKDYLYVSEIYRNGVLYARIDNRKLLNAGVEWL